MNRTEIAALYADASAFGGKTVTVCGWVRSIRDSKALGFIDLNDGSCFKGVQIVFEDSKVENFHEITRQNVGCALRVTGELLLTPQAKQPFEIHAQKIEVEGASTPTIPCRKNATPWNICAPSPICARVPIRSARRSGCVRRRPLPFTAFSRKEGLCMPTRL